MKNFINKIKLLIKKNDISYIDERAAACSYYTLLSFIPLIILILTLTKYFGIDDKLFIYILERIIPSDILNDAIISIVKEAYSKSFSTITISVIFTLWSAGKGFFSLCKGLNTIYEVENDNKYILFRLKAIISTIIFICAVVIGLILLVFGNYINSFLKEKFNIFNSTVDLLINLKILIGIFALTFIICILYRFIPKHEYKLKHQIPGALFAAVSCNIVSIFYSVYINVFTAFSLIYGSLTTIILAMMWVYACMYSILLGGHINKVILKKRKVNFK